MRKEKSKKVKKMESSGVIESSGCRSNDIDSGKDRRVGLVFDERMCKHYDPSDKDHPECPDRIKAIWDLLNSSGLAKRCIILKANDAEDNHLALVHTKNHIDLIKNISSQNSNKRKRVAAKFDSIYFNEGSTEASYLAAGSVIEAAEKVVKGELDSAFAIVRPPGHHAEEGEPMGFCLYNNVGIATSYLLNERRELRIKKILIVDWDVHHGNGTQKMFYKDPRVLLFSVHRYDKGTFYPGGHDGSYIMTGEEPGAGHNINVPWDHERCGDADYLAVWDHILIPVAKEFNPDMIFISAGFDAAIGDPLGGCSISPYGYSVMLDKLMEFAGGKIVMALEGGYNLKSLASSARACVEVLLHDKPPNVVLEASPFAATWRLIQEVRRELSTYWPVLAVEIPGNMVCQTAQTKDWCDMSPTECYDFLRSLPTWMDKSRRQGLTLKEIMTSLSYEMVQAMTFEKKEATQVEKETDKDATVGTEKKEAAQIEQIDDDAHKLVVSEATKQMITKTMKNIHNDIRDEMVQLIQSKLDEHRRDMDIWIQNSLSSAQRKLEKGLDTYREVFERQLQCSQLSQDEEWEKKLKGMVEQLDDKVLELTNIMAEQDHKIIHLEKLSTVAAKAQTANNELLQKIGVTIADHTRQLKSLKGSVAILSVNARKSEDIPQEKAPQLGKKTAPTLEEIPIVQREGEKKLIEATERAAVVLSSCSFSRDKKMSFSRDKKKKKKKLILRFTIKP